MENQNLNQNKMTAVEWLVGEIKSGLGITTVMVELAKEMEKEQREKDFVKGYKKRAEMGNSIFDETSEIAAKELFKETLK